MSGALRECGCERGGNCTLISVCAANRRIEDARDGLAQNHTELTEALRGLIDRLDEIHHHPSYNSVWSIYYAHGGRYDGPNYCAELERARSALAAAEATP